MVVDALSHNSIGELQALFSRLSLGGDRVLVAQFQIKSTWSQCIRDLHSSDKKLEVKFQLVRDSSSGDFLLNFKNVLFFRGRLCVPRDESLRRDILLEAHSVPFVMHPISMKMYRDLQELYWWPSLNHVVAEFVGQCLVCHHVKAENQCPSSLLQHISIP
ncbi:uncharacterized protein LOC120120732 [Hibiscus syriacus]|uniref:uncharacterized protein LOC120120732 n=1 Tax=Hibiscus syriacus TaxID=106335 RepID=UPI0019228A97|nr:uncharacterized protein LOC120120732 [Hibiscus syriacus]